MTANDTQIYVVFNTKFNKMEESKNLEQNLDKSNEKLHISDVSCSFFDKLKLKLKNDYDYYMNISIMCNEVESEKYIDRAEEILSILEWCDENYN